MSSIRDQILDAVTASFENMQAGLLVPGLPDAFSVTFANVQREPLCEQDWKKQYTLAVHDQTETKTRTTMFYKCSLPIVLEFRYVRQSNEGGSKELNRILYDIERWIAIDYTWGGLATNTEMTSSDIYVEDDDQKRVSGAVMCLITYRHYWNDPSRTA